MNQATPLPGLIRWTGYIALTLLIAIPIAVLSVRSGAWQQGLGLYAIACLGSTLLAIVFIVLLMLPRFAPARAETGKRLLLALPGTALLLALTSGGDAPPIHDITTNTVEPPQFVTAAQVRGEGANSLDIKPDFIAAQEKAYPDLATLRTELAAPDAFDRAITVANDLGWEIYFQDRDAGVIEAVDTTAIMGFKDDVVIRVVAGFSGTAIDLRSVSRVGLSDLGANAQRIRDFVAAFGA
ncbi:MAG: DUF1499 domain-containing protein [Halioglobus sp.]|nr:DUF1499 domain-containing protein [Halioglobus sp.]